MRKVYSIKPFHVAANKTYENGGILLRQTDGKDYELSVNFTQRGRIKSGETVSDLGARLFAEGLNKSITLEGELGEAYWLRDGLFLELDDDTIDEYEPEQVRVYSEDGFYGVILDKDRKAIRDRLDTLKQSALAKLSPAEKKALGLD